MEVHQTARGVIGEIARDQVGGGGKVGRLIEQSLGVGYDDAGEKPADGRTRVVVIAALEIKVEAQQDRCAGVIGQGEGVRREARFSGAIARLGEEVVPIGAAVGGDLHASRFVGGGVSQLALKAQRAV